MKKTKILAYYFGSLAILSGLAGCYYLFIGEANLFFATLLISGVSAVLFVTLMKRFDKMKIKVIEDCQALLDATDESLREFDAMMAKYQPTMRVAIYGGDTVLIDGNSYTTLTHNK